MSKITIPRDKHNDYDLGIVQQRQQFLEQFSGANMTHLSRHSFSPLTVRGNCENFTGVAQIPVRLAGPLQINGEYAQGEFIVPLATTEGTLIASFSRGMKIMNLCGGVQCTVQDSGMQRAPLFAFDSARQARHFVQWIKAHTTEIARVAESTSSVAKLKYIDPYLYNKFACLRFNFGTGDAAGQNMVSKATDAACRWILSHYEAFAVRRFFLDGNLATDKKASYMNALHTRGKRVTAEIVLKRQILQEHLRIRPEDFDYFIDLVALGAGIAGAANNNAVHAANGIAALFMATGQDVASVAESSTAILYSELTPEGDCYLSITLPSLIVATFGGGTGLPTQQECLQLLGCGGKSKAEKLAEIAAATVLAGEISLTAAIVASEWVQSHEQHGRNKEIAQNTLVQYPVLV